MDHSKELRMIADDIVKTEAGGLNNSQYWGLRLRLIADILESGGTPGALSAPLSAGHLEKI